MTKALIGVGCGVFGLAAVIGAAVGIKKAVRHKKYGGETLEEIFKREKAEREAYFANRNADSANEGDSSSEEETPAAEESEFSDTEDESTDSEDSE